MIRGALLFVIVTVAYSQTTEDIFSTQEDYENITESNQTFSSARPDRMNGPLPKKFQMMSNTQITVFFSVAGGTFLLMMIISCLGASYDVSRRMKSGQKPRTHA